MRCSSLVLAFVLAMLVTEFSSTAVQAENVATLKEQLEGGLKARLPREFAFIRRVVAFVESQQLSEELVKSTMQWARRKAKFKKYPFPYFEFAMREHARRLGLQL